MNIYEAAMQMETEGKATYQEMLAKTESAALQGVLKKLIAMEENHYEIFEAMRDEKPAISVDELCTKTIVSALKDAAKNNEEVPEKEEVIQLYENALELEKSATGRYEELGAEAKSEEEKAAFAVIAAEEKKHQIILQNIIDFIKDPEYFLAQAEFSNEGY